MAIVTMKRLRLIGLLQDRDPLFGKLQQLGCLEISEPDAESQDPQWAGLLRPAESTRSEKERLLEETDAALSTLDTYAPVKSGLLSPKPQVLESELFDPQTVSEAMLKVRRINQYAQDLQEAQAGIQKISSTAQTVSPWESLDIPLNTQSTQSVYVQFGMMPATADLEQVKKDLALAADASELYEASTDAEVHYLLLMCYAPLTDAALDALKPYGFSSVSFKGITGTAKETLAYLEGQKKGLEQKISSLKESISAMGDGRLQLQLCHDRMVQEIEKEQNKERLLDSERTFFLEGWVPADREKPLTDLLDSFGCAYELTAPTEEEYPEVPVELKSGKITSSLNTVTNMYALPAYGSVDPNPLMAPFFIFFYGMMMADMGYGLLMILGCALVIKKKNLRGKNAEFFNLFKYCGMATFFFGAITGSFFGDLIPKLTEMVSGTAVTLPSLFSPLDDALAVLIGSLVLGVIQIFTGMAVSMYNKIRRGQTMDALCSEGAWYLVFVLGGVAAVTGAVKPCIIAIVVLLVLTQGYGKKGILGKLSGIGGSLYNNITGYFSDILSYSRLMALMLAGAVIAQVFNTLGSLTGNVVLFFIISMVGNALNMALNLLGCYVHDMRLQCLEFFGRFYEDGGKPFTPVKIDTDYVDVIS